MVPPTVKDQTARDGLCVEYRIRHPTKECKISWAPCMDETWVMTPQLNKDSRPNKRSGKREAESDEREGSSKKSHLGKEKAA